MRIILSLLITLLSLSTSLAQKKAKKDSIPDGWKSMGIAELLFNQTAFNEDWQGGGTSNIAGNFNINWDLNYKRNKLSWDTKLISSLGLAISKDQRFVRKTTDRLEINSLLGSKIPRSKWYYSAFINFRTQMAPGYEIFDRQVTDGSGEVIEVVQDRREITDTFSPAYLQAGLGFLWKESNELKVNIAPATVRYIFVKSRFTAIDETNPEAVMNYVPYFGVAANESYRFELGAAVSVYYKEELLKNVVFENTLNLYADYIEKTSNVDVDYTLNIAMKVNEYLSANVVAQLIYDDNATSGLQVREVLGIGIKYAFLEWRS